MDSASVLHLQAMTRRRTGWRFLFILHYPATNSSNQQDLLRRKDLAKILHHSAFRGRVQGSQRPPWRENHDCPLPPRYATRKNSCRHARLLATEDASQFSEISLMQHSYRQIRTDVFGMSSAVRDLNYSTVQRLEAENSGCSLLEMDGRTHSLNNCNFRYLL